MKKVSLVLSAVVMTVLVLSSCGRPSNQKGAITEEIESYDEAPIGSQAWMRWVSIAHLRL